MIIIGITLTMLGILLLISFLLSRIKCKTVTEAIVCKIIVKKRYFRGRTIKEYTPVFEYSVNGKKYTYKADSSTRNSNKFFKGQTLNIYIDPKQPDAARYGSNAVYCIAGIIFAAAGMFFLILSCY